MRRLIAILSTMFMIISVSAQVKLEVIASAGGYAKSSGMSVSWTLGETIIPTFVSGNGNIILTHGFQQQVIVTAIEENIGAEVSVKVYPNPTSEAITIKFDLPVETQIVVTLLDSNGKLVKRDLIEANMTELPINLQDLAAGVYYLRLIKGNRINVYKVVKL